MFQDFSNDFSKNSTKDSFKKPSLDSFSKYSGNSRGFSGIFRYSYQVSKFLKGVLQMCFSIFLINIELFQRSLKKPFQKCPRFPPKNLHGICFKNPPEVASGILQRNRKSFHGIFAWIPLKFYYFFLYIQGFFKKILDIFIYKFFHRFLQIISHGFLHKRLKLLFQKTSLGFPQKFLRGFFRKMFHDFFLEFAPACKKFRIPSKISPSSV